MSESMFGHETLTSQMISYAPLQDGIGVVPEGLYPEALQVEQLGTPITRNLDLVLVHLVFSCK